MVGTGMQPSEFELVVSSRAESSFGSAVNKLTADCYVFSVQGPERWR